MKSFISAFALTCISVVADAQLYAKAGAHEPSQKYFSPLIINSVERVAYKISRPPGLRMRNVGRTLTVIGGAMLIGGIITYNNADKTVYTYQTSSGTTYTELDDQASIGALMIVAGAGMAVPGIIFWSKGSKKYKRHLEREAAFNFKGTELSLSYRF